MDGESTALECVVEGQPLGVLRPFNPVSWFHPLGIHRVLAKLTPRLPDVSGNLALTFTINPVLFADAAAAFDHARDHMRRMFFAMRQGVIWAGIRYVINAPYCVKVEFHKSGWVHFHVIFRTRRFIPAELIAKLWGLGRVNVQRISNKTFRYLLKYVTKAGGLPDWVLGRTRIRVFQSSRGFYVDGPGTPAKRESKKTAIKRHLGTIGERIERWRKTALFQHGDQFFKCSWLLRFSNSPAS